MTVGDIYAYILHFYKEQLNDIETNLSEEIISNSSGTINTDPMHQSASTSATHRKTITIPAPQEYSLFRPNKAKVIMGDIFEIIGEEMESIRDTEVEALNALDSDSIQSESDLSFLQYNDRKKTKDEDKSKIAKANERLFGSISLSFFPILS